MFSPNATKICVFITILLVHRASFVAGYANTYSGLVAGGHVVPLGIELFYTDKHRHNRTPYNHGMQCLVDDPRCQKPVFKKESGSVLFLGFELPTKVPTTVLKKFKGVELGKPAKMTLTLCYSAESTDDRKWRKANDKISKDKRCGKNIVEDIDLAMLSGYSYINYTLPSDTPKGKFFITAVIKCPIEGSSGEFQICGLDTTGGLDALVTREGVINKLGIAGTVESADARMKVKTSKTIYFKTMSSHHQPPLLVGGVIGFSIFSVALLVFFLVYEHVLRKNK